MKIEVEFWGVARRLAGTSRYALDLRDAATVGQALQVLPLREALQPVLPRCAFAVGAELVAADHGLRDGDVLAVLPPVSGG